MADEHNTPEIRPFLETIDELQGQITDTCSHLTKLKATLEKTKKDLKTKTSVTVQVNLLLSYLRIAKSAPEAPSVSQMTEAFEGELRTFQRKLQDGFPASLRQACEDARLECKAVTDGFGVGPFVVITENARESACIQYAKVAVAHDVPLNGHLIASHAAALKASLIDTPVDLSRFQKDLHEAIRVAVARRESRPPVAELRVELPAAFKEICFIRNATGGTSSKRPGSDEYSLARFIIELKQFIQSDANLKTTQQCRLEPAVIENTKNPKRSIFIPRDVACGFGEGTYYQAILMQQR